MFADEATSAAKKEMIGIILMKIQVLLSCLDDLQPYHLVKAAVTHWLLHGQTCKRVREWYEQIVLALDKIIWKNSNSEWLSYWSNLLIFSVVFQITFLEDILSVTNILSLILQSDRKDFAAVSRAVRSTIAILEDIQNNSFQHIYKISRKQTK